MMFVRRFSPKRAAAVVALMIGVCMPCLLAGCASPAPRGDLYPVAHLDNQAYVRYASIWSEHTFDSPRAEARVAIMTADPSWRNRLAAGGVTSGAAAGDTRDGAAIGGAQVGEHVGGTESGTAGASADAGAAGASADAGVAAASADAGVAAAGADEAVARGQTQAGEAAAGSEAEALQARADAQAAAAGTADDAQRGGVDEQAARGDHTATEHVGRAEDATHGAQAAAAAVGAQADARAAGARVDVTAQRPQLVLRKIANPAQALPGDRVRFTFHLHNPGPLVVERVRIIDELPDGFEVIGAGGAELETASNGDRHLLLDGQIPVSGNRTVTLDTRLNRDTLETLEAAHANH